MSLFGKVGKKSKFIVAKNSIIQFSPVRSGSTLIYNILRELFPNYNIQKTHNIKSINIKNKKIVITYRHPIDCVASLIQIQDDNILTKKSIDSQINVLMDNGLNDLINIINKKNILFLKYENFSDDFNIIFDSIEAYFNIKINNEKRELLSLKYNINNIKKISDKLGVFSKWDKVTHWHGKHISKFNGKPNYHEDFFTHEQLDYIKSKMIKYLNILGY